MPECVHDNANSEQAWVINNDVTTRSHENSSDTTNQGSYTDAVCRLSKVFDRFNKLLESTTLMLDKSISCIEKEKIINDHEINWSVIVENDFDRHRFSR